MSQDGVDFVTLGMFIIDDIYPPPSADDQTPRLNIIGGAGTYSAIGARLFCPPPRSKAVGWIVDAGTDFPPDLRDRIASWETGVLMRARPAPTTRGWNGYSGNEYRAFKYLTEKKRLTAEDLDRNLLGSKSFHLICSPSRCIDQVNGIQKRREEAFGVNIPRPIFIWEPVPDLCIPTELENTYAALKLVDVVSPNHDELAALFGASRHARIDISQVEDHAQRFLEAGIGSGGQGAIVVRVGASGCFVLTSKVRRWLPAYHQDPSKVVDPTGGGNGFLGGLAIRLVHDAVNVVEAARWGSVAASFCIEQLGMPLLHVLKDHDTHERWNGVTVLERLVEFQQRTEREAK